MARSYSCQYTGSNGSTSYEQLCINAASASAGRARIFEFAIGASAAPNDYASRYNMVRHSTLDPTGGSTTTANPLDPAEPAAGMSPQTATTGATTIGLILYMASVNMRATFRWVAAPGKEFVSPVTIHNGLGIIIAAQSTAYNTDLTIMWEE